MDKGIWEEVIGENANKKGVRSHNRCKGRVCSEEGEGVFTIKRREEEGEEVYQRTVKKRTYPTVKVTTNGTGVLCRKKEWKKENGLGLSILK